MNVPPFTSRDEGERVADHYSDEMNERAERELALKVRRRRDGASGEFYVRCANCYESRIVDTMTPHGQDAEAEKPTHCPNCAADVTEQRRPADGLSRVIRL